MTAEPVFDLLVLEGSVPTWHTAGAPEAIVI